MTLTVRKFAFFRVMEKIARILASATLVCVTTDMDVLNL